MIKPIERNFEFSDGENHDATVTETSLSLDNCFNTKITKIYAFLIGDQTVRLVFRDVLDYKLYMIRSTEKK